MAVSLGFAAVGIAAPGTVVIQSCSAVGCGRSCCRFPTWKVNPWTSLTSSHVPLRYKDGGKLHEWKRSPVKAKGAGSDGYIDVEVLDPKTGEYSTLAGTDDNGDDEDDIDDEESEEYDKDDEEELMKRFAAAVGLEDSDVVEKLFDKMRNPSSNKIVKQLEEGLGDVEDLLMDMYGGNDDFRGLLAEVEKMIGSGDPDSAREIIEGNYEAVLEQLDGGVFGVEQAAMLDILAHLYMNLGDQESAEMLIDQAKQLLELMSDSEVLVGNILEHLASMYLKMGKPKDALPLFTRSLRIKKGAQEEDIPSVVRTMLGLANTYSELNMTSKSIELYQQILAHAEGALGTEDEDLAAPLMHLGSSLLEDGKLEEAELAIRRALSLTEKTYGDTDGRYGVAACVLAQVKSSKGEFDAAVDWYRKGLQVMESCSDFAEDESLETIRMDLAALLNVLGRETEMNEVLKGLDLKDKKSLEYFSSQLVEHLEKLAEKYAEEGELQKAESALRRCLQLLLANLGPDAPQVSVILQLLATLLHSQPDRESEAEPLARESLRIREKAFGKHHISVGEACSQLASILHQSERDEEAVHLMYRVIEIQDKEFGPDHPDIEEALDVLSMLLMNIGRYSDTIPIVKRLERLRAQNMASSSY